MIKKKKPKTKTWYIKKADKLYSLNRRTKVGHCEKCGRKENLQLAHIISRDCKKLRYSDDNSFVLCYSCHFTFHRKPLQFSAFVEEKKGKGSCNRLIQESNKLKSLGIDYYERLIDKLKETQ